MFSIFQRKWTPLEDNLAEEARLESVQRRNVLLKEANANISYLIVICCFAATISIILLVQRAQCGWGPALCAVLTSHFLLTLMMIVKRLHALFAREYEER